MHYVDYTHPTKIPSLHLAHDQRSSEYYLRLDELPRSHPYYARDWAIFRYPEWLEGGSAWLQAYYIAENLHQLIDRKDLKGEVRPIVGSGDFAFDEALAQSLKILGFNPLVAEEMPKTSISA